MTNNGNMEKSRSHGLNFDNNVRLLIFDHKCLVTNLKLLSAYEDFNIFSF